jgi:hypothetical protein
MAEKSNKIPDAPFVDEVRPNARQWGVVFGIASGGDADTRLWKKLNASTPGRITGSHTR